jgi:hypothetical protein
MGGKWFAGDASFIVRIEKVRTVQSRKKQDLVFIECTVCETSKPDENPVGSRASQCLNFSEHDAAPGNFKAFIAAANGLDPSIKTQLDSIPEREWEPLCDLAVSAENPLAGLYCGLETALVDTKAKTKFTKHFWSPLDQDECAAAYGGVESAPEVEREAED